MTKHEFEQLKKGDITGYHSHSEADMAFCEYLASRGATAEEIDREYRTSGLMRDKWDRKQQGATYGSITIGKSRRKSKMNELKSLLSTYLTEDEAVKLTSIISKETPILIEGVQGATGKTTLCRKLCELGYNAEEAWKAKKVEEHDNGFKVVISLNKKII